MDAQNPIGAIAPTLQFVTQADSLRARMQQVQDAGKQARPDELRDATREFEALFLGYLLKVMRSTVPSEDSESSLGKDFYIEMFDSEIAMNIARNQSIGIGDMMYRQLLETQKDEMPLADRTGEAPVVAGEISSLFGSRPDPFDGTSRFHGGVDIAAGAGTPFRAAQPGKVVFADYLGGYGNTVIVEHGNGDRTLYGHASNLSVRPGDHVEAQDVLGLVGSTGRSTAPHLHFELQRNGQKIDPAGLFTPKVSMK